MLLCLSACGTDDPICGSYRCVGAETEDLYVKSELLGKKGIVLVLNGDGTGTLTRGDGEGAFTWARVGEGLRLDAAGRLYDADLEGEAILLRLEDGVILRFERADAKTQPAGQELTDSGDWYGWWAVSNSQGEMPEVWRDCCARLESGDYGPVLRFWDEESSWDEPLALVRLRAEDTELVSESGWFLLSEIGDGALRLDPAADRLELSGSCEGGGERFDYEIHLRPWGAEWQEETLHLPWRYRDWYLPLIGEDAPMPDRIG